MNKLWIIESSSVSNANWVPCLGYQFHSDSMPAVFATRDQARRQASFFQRENRVNKHHKEALVKYRATKYEASR